VEIGTPTLLVPQGAEERAVARAVPGARVVPIRAGAAAARWLPPLLDGPLVLLGLCGALAPYPVGTIVVCEVVGDEIGSVSLEDVPAVAAPRVRAFTAADVVTRADAKRALALRWGADVVEMEGIHVARALSLRNLRCAMVRVVSDAADADLPPLEQSFDREGNLRPASVALALARDPRAAARFVADVRVALRALADVAHTVSGV
jgi:hypothetical protein